MGNQIIRLIVGRWVERLSFFKCRDIKALPCRILRNELIVKAQGCRLVATMGVRDQETRVYARARLNMPNPRVYELRRRDSKRDTSLQKNTRVEIRSRSFWRNIAITPHPNH